MLKPDCPCSFDFPKSREIRVLGIPLLAKNYICAPSGGSYREKPDPVLLELSVVLTEACDARCPFCIAQSSRSSKELDPERLRGVLEQLKAEDVLRGIKITGGEPGLNIPLLDAALRAIFDVCGPGMEVSLSTNGTAVPRLKELRDLHRLESVHISRHHWDDRVNDLLFGRTMLSAEALRSALEEIGDPDLFVLNCLLLRDAVASPEDAHRYLDFAVQAGAGKVAFITADPVNTWTADRRIPFSDVLREDDPSLLFTRGFRDFDLCRCQDGVYVSPAGKLIRFYGRHSENRACGYCRGLVYGADNLLRDGFGGRVLNPPSSV